MRGAGIGLSLALLMGGCGATVASTVGTGPLAAPRPIAPLSTATVTAQNPTLHWSLAPGSDGAHVQICHDRACTAVEQTLDATGSHAPVPSLLAPGVHFWRIAARVGTVVGTTWSPVWEFFVGHRSAPVDTSFGTIADFNGDGYADAIVGGTNNTFVYFGAAVGVNTSPTVLAGPAMDSGVTVAVGASAGDVNGDGFADLVVSNGTSASLYLGGADGLSIHATTTFHGPHVDYPFGGSVAGVGDVNGDGYADLLVSAAVSRSSVAANAYVYLGGSSGLATSAIALTPPDGTGGFGSPMASAGDVNGDGYGDLIVSALVADNVGAAYVYLGGTGWMTSAPIALSALAGVTGFGISVAGAGDVNGDGYTDVAVGADISGVSFFFGAASGISGTQLAVWDNESVGRQVAGAGDVNGDGFDDVAVMDSGYLLLSLGQSGGLTTTWTPLTNSAVAMAGAGDLNGDGFDDVIVGGESNGTASIYLGAASSIQDADASLPMPAITLTNVADPLFGDWVASAVLPSAVRACRRVPPLHPPPFAATMRPCVGQSSGFRWHC